MLAGCVKAGRPVVMLLLDFESAKPQRDRIWTMDFGVLRGDSIDAAICIKRTE